jgi:sirohydrochlorin cobaltochelatase
MRSGIVLFGHGARDPRWADTLHALAGRIRTRAPDVPVRAAFLEFMTPDLGSAIDALVAEGVTSVTVAPVFLAAGGHVLRDLPDRLAGIAVRHPGLTLRVEPALGSLPSVLDAMARHCLEVVSQERLGLSAAPTAVPESGEKGVDAT